MNKGLLYSHACLYKLTEGKKTVTVLTNVTIQNSHAIRTSISVVHVWLVKMSFAHLRVNALFPSSNSFMDVGKDT